MEKLITESLEIELIRFDKTPWCKCIFDVEIQGPLVYVQEGDADMGEKSQGVPEVHF